MVLSLFPKEEYKPRFKGLVPNVYNACYTLYPALNFGLAKYMTWFEHSRWGFNTMQLGKGCNDNVSIANYGYVGLAFEWTPGWCH